MATPRKPKARKPATSRRGGTLSRVGSVNAPTQKRKTRSGSPAKRKTAAEKAKDKKAREKRERSMSPKEKKDRAARNKVTADRRKQKGGSNAGTKPMTPAQKERAKAKAAKEKMKIKLQNWRQKGKDMRTKQKQQIKDLRDRQKAALQKRKDSHKAAREKHAARKPGGAPAAKPSGRWNSRCWWLPLIFPANSSGTIHIKVHLH